jgi:hypothetical protein
MTNDERARKNGLAALATVKGELTKVGWDPQQTDEEGVLRVDFSIDKIPVADALVTVWIDLERFLILFRFRDRAAPKRRAAVTEFITRANCGLVTGNFEMDYADGAVGFKSSVDFTQVELSRLLVRNAVLSAMDVVEHYANQLVAVLRGKMTARAAIRAVEGTS